MMMCCYVIKESSENPDSLIKIITPIVIILTFIIKEVLTYRYFVKQHNQSRVDFETNFNNSIELAKKNWYLNVLVQPNVKTINEFYEASVIGFIETYNELKTLASIVTHKEFKKLSVAKAREFKYKKRELEFNFINLIRSSSNLIANQLTGKINELDDLISKELIDNDITKIDVEEFERKINLNKVELLTILFKYIENTKNK